MKRARGIGAFGFGMVLLGAIAPVTEAASLSRKTEVRIYSTPGAPRKTDIRFSLYQEGKALVCETAEVPPHEVKVKGLTDLQAPFPAAKSLGFCAQIVSWTPVGKGAGAVRSACYVDGKIRVLDELIRRCLTI